MTIAKGFHHEGSGLRPPPDTLKTASVPPLSCATRACTPSVPNRLRRDARLASGASDFPLNPLRDRMQTREEAADTAASSRVHEPTSVRGQNPTRWSRWGRLELHRVAVEAGDVGQTPEATPQR